MTVAATYTPPQYTGNGVTTIFAFSNSFFDPTELVIDLFNTSTGLAVSPAAVLNGAGTYDYTVTGVKDPDTGEYLAGGSITFNAAPPATFRITIYRSVAATQNVALTNNAKFPAKTLEGALDRNMMIIQQLVDGAGRTIRAPISDVSPNMLLGTASARANTIPSFASDGSVENVLNKGQVQAAVASYLAGAVPAIATAAYASSLAAAKAMFGAPLVLAAGLALAVAGRASTADGYQGVFVYDSADTTTTFLSDGLGFVDNQNRRFKRVYDGVLVFANWFGVKGDVNDAGVGTDNTTSLQNWLTSLGTGYYGTAGANVITGPGHGILPAGKYKYTATLTIPVNAKVSGVPSKSVFRPSSAVTTAAVIQTAGSTLDGIVIDGLNAGNIVGLSQGASGMVNDGFTYQVQVVRFNGAAGFALNIANVVTWAYTDCYFGDSTFSTNIVDSGAGTPTTLKFLRCKFKGNSRRGLSMYTGQECSFIGCIFENNGEDGSYVNVSAGGGGSAVIWNVLFLDCYWESNQTNAASGAARHALYHAYVRGDQVKFRDCFFAHGAAHATFASEARAVQFDNAQDFLFDHTDVANEAGQISVIGSSTGAISNWIEACGEILTTVSDTTGNVNAVRYIYEKHDVFTPLLTFTTPGTLAVTYATQVGRQWRNGRTVTCEVNLKTSVFTLGTASGSMRVSLPQTSRNVAGNESIAACSWQGITPAAGGYTDINARVAANANYADFVMSGSAKNQVAVAATDTPTGGNVILQFTVTYEL